MEELALLCASLAGAVLGCGIALVPGLHVFNVAGLALLLYAQAPFGLSEQALALFLLGALVGWSVVNVVPTVFLFAPDDAHVVVVLPATKYLMRGRGAEAALLIGSGSLCALLGLVILSPILDEAIRPLRAILQPHTGWMLAAIIAFLLLGEWPRANDLASPLRRLTSAWAYLGAGLLTFALSGLLGIVLFYRSPIAVESGFVNLMPAFVGLFAVPGLLQVLLLGARPPRQHEALSLQDIEPRLLLRGALTGLSGGLFAGILPVVSGGVGGLLAGHATALWNERAFLISLGASKVAYYVGSLLLLFVPGLTLARGGMAWMISSIYVPYGWRTYWLAVAAVALCGALAFVALVSIIRVAARLVNRWNPQWLAGAALLLIAALTMAFTNWAGLMVMGVATFIGLIPVLVGGRRINGLGVLLAPITLNVIGVGPAVARWLGLL